MNNIFKIFRRHISRRPLYTAITLGGFTLGIAASLLIYFWIRNELGYEKFHPDYRRIYRVLTLSRQGGEIVKSAGNFRPVVRTLESDYPQIEYAAFISNRGQNVPLQTDENSEKIEAQGGWVSNHFFDVFGGFTFVEGSAAHAYDDPSNIVITEDLKQKLFGDEPALGRSIMNNQYASFKEIYKVGAVIRIPQQSHIGFDYMLSEKYSRYTNLSENWSDKAFVRVYIKLNKGAGIDEDFLSQVTNHISRYSSRTDKLMFQPIADIHLHSDYEPFYYDRNISSYKYVWIFSGLALLIILMASVNFSILSVARASERQTEIGIKRATGAGKRSIAAQFMGESIIMTTLATLIALGLVMALLPWISNLSGQTLMFAWGPSLVLAIILFALFVSMLSGIYPSLYLSSFSPTGIFRGSCPTGSGTSFISFLSTFQFAIAIFFIIATTLFIRQMNYIRNKDLGIEKQNVIVVPTGLWYDNQAFKDELMRNPDVLGVSASSYAPLDNGFETSLAYIHDGKADSLYTFMFWADEDFAETYRLEIVKGQFYQYSYSDYWQEGEESQAMSRDGDKSGGITASGSTSNGDGTSGSNRTESGGDNPEGSGKETVIGNQEGGVNKEYAISIPVVINETAEKMLGFDDPLGERLGNNYVVTGVVKDFHFRPLRFPIGPLVIMNNPEAISTMNIRISPENRSQTLAFINDTYKKFRDDRDLSYDYFEDLMAAEYQAEIRLQHLTTVFASLAIVIAVMGVLGMAFFTSERRTKEIGIRKVNGAKVSEVLLMLNKDFAKWVIIAVCIASPVSWYILNKWLQNFAYRTGLSWWIFVLAGILALGIALLTVSLQSYRAASRNPVEALRYE